VIYLISKPINQFLKMKKTILMAAVIGLTVASCAKDRTCTCTNSSDAPGSTSSTSTYTLVGVSKGQAKANCLKTTSTYTTPTGNVTTTNDCKLD